MKSIRCRLSYATWCEHFKSGECMSPVKCKYQTEHISVKFPEAIFVPTKEAWEKMQAENSRLTAENAELRERLDKAVEEENKINNGELVGAIWFKSWLNGIVCCGRVVGYGDGGFVIESGDDLISAKKIYTSREQAEKYENKNDDDLAF